MNRTAPGVLFILNSLCIGGAERHVITLLNSLDTGRFRLSLAYLKRVELLLPQLHVERLDSVTCCDVTQKIDFHAIRILANLIAQQEIDTIVCTNEYALLYGFLARLLARRPVKLVEVFHTTILQTMKEKLQFVLYKPLFNRSDLLIFVCNNQREYWSSRGLDAINATVIYNGVDSEYFTDTYSSTEKAALRSRYGLSMGDYVIGICAVLRPEKAHGDALQALARLRAMGLPAKALLIGDGPERAAIEALAASLGIGADVAITGFQSDVRPYVAACDVMVLASHTIETFSIATLESMALGKPVVLTRIGGADEQVIPGSNGFLFEPGDIDALTEHLKILASAQTRAVMGRAAIDIVRERFTTADMVAAFSNELTRLAPDPTRQATPGTSECPKDERTNP
jgi:glycosyltransferase involved in cell wall biosynthesis